jgi:hypothetical protein
MQVTRVSETSLLLFHHFKLYSFLSTTVTSIQEQRITSGGGRVHCFSFSRSELAHRTLKDLTTLVTKSILISTTILCRCRSGLSPNFTDHKGHCHGLGLRAMIGSCSISDVTKSL